MSIQRSPLMLCALVLTNLTVAQEISRDSLRATWADTTLSIRQRVPALAQWLDSDSTMTVEQAVRIAVGERMDTSDAAYARQLGLATLALSSAYGYRRRYTEAIATAKQALRFSERSGPALDVALIHTYLGRQFGDVGAEGQAVRHQLAALHAYEQAQDTFGQVSMNNALAFSFSIQGINDRSIAYYERNLALVRHRRPEHEVDVMLRIADQYKAMEDLPVAMAWLDSATRVIELDGGVDRERMINWMRGDLMMDRGDCAGALAEFRLSLAAIDADPYNPPGRSWIRSRMAMACVCAKDFRAARDWAMAGLALAEEHHLRKEELDNLFPLAEAHEGLGDTRQALRYFKRYHALLDSTINTESARSLSDAALTLDFEKRQLADSLLAVQRQNDAEVTIAKERSRRNLLLAAGLVAVVFGSISYRQRRHTQRALHRSDELLLNILPEEVADELKSKGHADARHFENVTILFTDFKGFTSVAEQLTPAELVEELNTCFKAFDHIITARGIEKIKTIGDAYMAAGGLPRKVASGVGDVVQAALDMQDFMQKRKAERIAVGKPAFDMRLGIHTGPVVAGIVGVKKFQYDIWGDTVNTASRMESSGEVGRVNISESTYREIAAQPGWVFTPRGKVQAKGKGELEMYFVQRN